MRRARVLQEVLSSRELRPARPAHSLSMTTPALMEESYRRIYHQIDKTTYERTKILLGQRYELFPFGHGRAQRSSLPSPVRRNDARCRDELHHGRLTATALWLDHKVQFRCRTSDKVRPLGEFLHRLGERSRRRNRGVE